MILKKSTDFYCKNIGEEYLLVPITNIVSEMDATYTLNDSGAYIWEKIDGKATTLDIAKSISEEFKIPLETALKDIEEFADSLPELITKVL